MSAKLAKVIVNKDYGVIVSAYVFTNKILSRESSYIADVAMSLVTLEKWQ